ncbi:hypothetical protein FOC1_g10014774, partial [Fusarium oxysporum f. sp. cubense race 1]
CNDAVYNTPKNVVISLQSRSRVPANIDVLSVFSRTLLRQEYDAVSPLVVQRQPASRCLSASTNMSRMPRDNRIAELKSGTDFASPVVEVLRSDKRVLGSVEVRGLMVEDMTMLICSSSSTGVSHLPAQHGQPGLFALELELVETPDSLRHTTWAPCAP